MHATAPATKLPLPQTAFGRTPLDDDVVIRWPEMLAYYERLAELDERLLVEHIGRDWSGQPLILLTLNVGKSEARRQSVAITASVHADELGGCQMTPSLVYELLTTTDLELSASLARVTLLIVPCVNPGGLELVADWRARPAGEPWAGSPPPEPLHPIGHDLNRDWIMQTQPETRAVVERVFNRFRPSVVLDLHEMAPNGPRYALPPYVEPSDPNIPADISRRAGELGVAIADAMTRHGKTGVVTGRFFDSFSPARAYLPYHGGVRVLCEAAGTRCGSPLHLSAGELANYGDYDPRATRDLNRPPWPGGRWSLRDVGEHHRIAILTALTRVSRLAQPSSLPAPSEAFLIFPIAMQPDPTAARDLISTLLQGDVNLRRAISSFQHDDLIFPAGTIIVDADQPNWPWAKTLLSVQRYVEHGNSTLPPYDVTAHTLPLLMGVDVIQVSGLIALKSEPLAPMRISPPRTCARSVGIYRSRRPDASEAGWAMTMLEKAGVRAQTLTDETIRAGDLGNLDAIVLPHQQLEHLLDGLNLADYPREFVGGIGKSGMSRLKQWVADGGTLIAIDGACRAVARTMNLPIDFIERGFRAPGSILRLELDMSHGLTQGCGGEIAVMNLNSPAFDIDDGEDSGIRIIGRYPNDDPLLSGMLDGWTALAGRAALVELTVGRGRIVLFGFRALFRGQTLSSQRLVLNAIRSARSATRT